MTSSSFSTNPAVVGGIGLTLLTGFFLAKTAAPYGTTMLTIHKLTAVGIIVFVALRARHAHMTTGLSSITWMILVAGAAAFFAMIGTGGAMSAMGNPPSAVATVHRIVPYVAVALTLTALYLIPIRAE